MLKLQNNINYKLLYISILYFFILTINSQKANAQFFDGGQNPSGLHWRQIRTQHFQILYPTLLESEAQRMANSLDFMIQRVSHSLNKEPRAISVILQNQTIESNGFVQLAPRRSEFYTLPAQEFDYQDWLNSLAVHELRHVVQIDKLTGKVRAPFESLAFAIFGISLPAWFFEGDAVLTETLLTNAGRGRQPSWEMPFRANVLSGRNFSYAKNYLGSLKDRTSGYYPLGFFMVSKLRRDYGNLILDTLINEMAKHPLRLFNLSNTSKKLTGLSTTAWYHATTQELKKQWSQQLSKTKTQDYTPVNARKKEYTEDYLLPQQSKNGSIIALKHSKAHTAQLVEIDEFKKERLVIAIGIQQESNFHLAGNTLVWDELREDVRFSKRSYSVLCSYNLETKKYRQITHKTRLFSPSLSPDGSKIIAVNVDLSNHMSFVELDATTGTEVTRYQNEAFHILQSPQYHSSGTKIVYLNVSQNGKSIEELDLQTGKTTTRLAAQSALLARPTYAFDEILFKGHYNGIDNIYHLDSQSKISQISYAKFGAFSPSFSEQTAEILFNNFGPLGYDIVKIAVKEANETPLSAIENQFIEYAKPLQEAEGPAINFSTIPKQQFTSTKYSPWKHALNLHSFVPTFGTNAYTDELNLGIKLISNNLLNTFDFYAGYHYNQGLNKNEFSAGFTYKGLYPIFKFDYENRARRTTYNQSEIAWREQESSLSIKFPFSFNYLNKHGYADIEVASSYTSRYHIKGLPAGTNLPTHLDFPMRYSISIGQNNRMGNRDLGPKWGQNILVNYQHFPFDSQLNGTLLSIQSLFFSPGLGQNHSFSVEANYQKMQGDAFQWVVDIPTISGYSFFYNPEPLENTLLLDYRFPLAYPDWDIWGLAYIKRFRAGLFADFENLNASNLLPRSYGFELKADLNAFRFYSPNVTLGGKIIFHKQLAVQNPIFEFGITYSY